MSVISDTLFTSKQGPYMLINRRHSCIINFTTAYVLGEANAVSIAGKRTPTFHLKLYMLLEFQLLMPTGLSTIQNHLNSLQAIHQDPHQKQIWQ